MNLYVHIIAAKIFAPLIIFVIVKKSFVKKDKERATNSLYINEINSNLTKKLFKFFLLYSVWPIHFCPVHVLGATSKSCSFGCIQMREGMGGEVYV